MIGSNNYLSPSITPYYPPTTLDVGVFKNFAGQGYLWSYYQTPPSSWNKSSIDGSDILGFFIVNGEQTLREMLANQIKPTLEINKAVFYCYRLPSGKTNIRSSEQFYAFNQIQTSVSYVFVQIAKYRSYATQDIMASNLLKMIAFFTAANNKVKGSDFTIGDFRRLGIDNDFTETMTSTVTFRGLTQTPFVGCTPSTGRIF